MSRKERDFSNLKTNVNSKSFGQILGLEFED